MDYYFYLQIMIPTPNTTEVMISRIAISTPATAPPVFEVAEIVNSYYPIATTLTSY